MSYPNEIIAGYTNAFGNTTPFQYINGRLTLMFGNNMMIASNGGVADEFQDILGYKQDKFAGGEMLFHLSTPQQLSKMKVHRGGEAQIQSVIMGNTSYDVDYYIDQYSPQATFNKMVFAFQELDYMLPSSSLAHCFTIDNKTVIQIDQPQNIQTIHFCYQNKTVELTFRIVSTLKAGHKATAETLAQASLSFENTDDYSFFIGLYITIRNFFSFMCNRRNLTLSSATLHGSCPSLIPGRIDQPTSVASTIVYYEKYLEEIEDPKIISKSLNLYHLYKTNIEGLLHMFVDDKVNITSLHTSQKARQYFDLKQCLHITAAFEYYQRAFTPEISSSSTQEVCSAIKELIANFAETLKGKKKSRAKSIGNNIQPIMSLKDKIIKLYVGYDNWSPLVSILSSLSLERCEELASVANEWRNELAHEKREYEPTIDVINAIRMVELVNYSIVLRKAGYPDENIKAILDKMNE